MSKDLGHSSIAITADTYSHLLPGVGRAAAQRAEAMVPRAPRDTAGLSSGSHDVEHDVQTAADSENAQVSGVVSGGPPGTRTPNPKIKSLLLCQLS